MTTKATKATKATYKLDKGYAIPQWGEIRFVKASRDTTEKQKPLVEMKRGESFVVPCTNPTEATLTQRALSSAACRLVREVTPSKKFATRQVKSGVRVWRTK